MKMKKKKSMKKSNRLGVLKSKIVFPVSNEGLITIQFPFGHQPSCNNPGCQSLSEKWVVRREGGGGMKNESNV